MVDELVDGGAGFEEVADDQRGGEVVVHGVVALLAEGFYHLFRFGVTLRGNLNAREVVDGVEELL